MMRTPLSVPIVQRRAAHSRFQRDMVPHIRAIAAQYEMTRNAMLLLSAETTRLAATGARNIAASNAHSAGNTSQLVTIVNDMTDTLVAAVDPVRDATSSLEQLTSCPGGKDTLNAASSSQARMVAECASLVRSLDAAIAELGDA